MAPFRQLFAFVFFDGDFDTAQDFFTDLADGAAQSENCLGRIEVKDRRELLWVKVGISRQTAPGKQGVGGADGRCVDKGHAFVIVMILLQIRSVNDAEDVLLVGKEIFCDFDGGNLFKHFTEDLLLSSMETAGAKDMPEDAERKGLGTPATRAGILEKLVSTGMLERRKVKKQTILVPTALGNSLITVLPEQLQSPLLTAEWENRLSQVQKGELEPEEFLDGIRGMLTDLVKDYRPVSGADILFPSAEKTVGKCPRCGRPVIERSKGYFCTGQDCKFVLWRDSRFFTLKQKALDRKTAQLLLEKGRAPLKGCVSSKTGKVYDAAVVLEDDGERAHFKLVFGNG